ncbi:MAG TPA: sigma-54 dependent transcriptional regulator [bacterium]|nr:sigma-54 dependent transcriptional regulator [bacterium]HPN43388.1 sigma-54 dependent transcriptional regulator [bacterium]
MSSHINILLLDDNHEFAGACCLLLQQAGYHVDLATTVEEGLKLGSSRTYQVALVDYRLPGMNGIEVMRRLKKENPLLEVIIITGHATLEMAVEAGRGGAFDYISKPFEPDKLLGLVTQLAQKFRGAGEQSGGAFDFVFDGAPVRIIGASSVMQQIFSLIDKIAPTESTVLILGESGTGKELVAKAIHAKSLRADKPFFAMDCGSLVESLFESELFGHAKGSFTGAYVTKHGAFELANNGTFFFDEIGNISLNVQAKILRTIQEKEFRRVGDTTTIKVDVRMIAATNLDLMQAVGDGTFREDLYYRISVIPLKLPALRDRRDDIPLLVDYFIKKHNYRRRGRDIQSISPDALDMLTQYNWPGNIRELENVIERAIVIEESLDISSASLPIHIQRGSEDTHREALSLADVERNHISKILKMTDRNITHAARLLDIDRKTLYDKIRRYNLS